jgi:starch synthase
MEASEGFKSQCMVVLGERHTRCKNLFGDLKKANPDRFALAHQILAGSDILLMPAIYEPYGLSQMHALKYGTIPIVSSVAGFDNSIQPFDDKTGTGFKFTPNDRKSFQQALQNYLICFTDKPRWERLIKNDMDMDCNWDNSAQQYFRLFEDIQLNH